MEIKSVSDMQNFIYFGCLSNDESDCDSNDVTDVSCREESQTTRDVWKGGEDDEMTERKQHSDR